MLIGYLRVGKVSLLLIFNVYYFYLSYFSLPILVYNFGGGFMPILERDPHSGAIDFKLTEEEKTIQSIIEENKELRNRLSHIECTLREAGIIDGRASKNSSD